LQITVGNDTAGNNEIWFADGNNTVWRLNRVTLRRPGVPIDKSNQIQVVTDAGVETNTGGFGTQISSTAAFNGVFFLDGMNQIWMFAGGAFTPTGGFGTRLTAF
jgi:hypothetical protein